ncbi:MAG TPA: hypothetical protein VGR38_00565 [Candidatus Polarisedimenticolia bacterium]|nr:hypothetical protein [Candidatus Polarisedimenticolia bacterium]
MPESMTLLLLTNGRVSPGAHELGSAEATRVAVLTGSSREDIGPAPINPTANTSRVIPKASAVLNPTILDMPDLP